LQERNNITLTIEGEERFFALLRRIQLTTYITYTWAVNVNSKPVYFTISCLRQDTSCRRIWLIFVRWRPPSFLSFNLWLWSRRQLRLCRRRQTLWRRPQTLTTLAFTTTRSALTITTTSIDGKETATTSTTFTTYMGTVKEVILVVMGFFLSLGVSFIIQTYFFESVSV
jgi:hypothetical protein